MNAEMAVVGPARIRLPSIADYVGAIWNLGRRSLAPGLPALAFVYFYRLGLGAYLTLSDTTYPQGMDALGIIGPQLAVIAAFVPLLLMIYTAFLPLQDSILRARPVTFLGAIRRVFETAWNLTLSGTAQAVILLLPLAVLLFITGLVLPDTGGEADPTSLVVMSFVLLAGLAWALIASLPMAFATPAVVLDDEGPIQSLRTSVRLTLSHLGGILGRFVGFGFPAIVIYCMVRMPTVILTNAAVASGAASVPIKLAALIWASAVDTLFFPFWVAALMVLYRALVPPAAATRGGAPIAIDEDQRPALATRAPFE
jgi:hypothetical protein